MRKVKGSGRTNGGILPNSLKIISSCLKTVSTNASTVVRSAGASVAASIAVAAASDVEKDQVLWAGFDKLELCPTIFRNVLLLGYTNGFQVIDVEDSSNFHELVSKRDGPVTFLQMQPIPVNSEAREGFRALHPLLLVVAGDEVDGSDMVRGAHLSGPIRDNTSEPQPGNCISTPTVVRFYSLKSDSYVHVLRFRSAVHIIRCSPRIIAVALTSQVSWVNYSLRGDGSIAGERHLITRNYGGFNQSAEGQGADVPIRSSGAHGSVYRWEGDGPRIFQIE